jgi:cytochrome c553
MTLGRTVAVVFACVVVAAPAFAQDGTQQSAQHPGRSVVMSKCFQCHTDAMFRDQRQEEIKLMADYLGNDFGPNSKPASTPSR